MSATQEHVIISAMLAMTNLGLGMPEKRDITALKYSRNKHDVESAMCHLAGGYMEDEHHEAIFFGEAQTWFDLIEKDGIEQYRTVHAKHFDLYKEA